MKICFIFKSSFLVYVTFDVVVCFKIGLQTLWVKRGLIRGGKIIAPFCLSSDETEEG